MVCIMKYCRFLFLLPFAFLTCKPTAKPSKDTSQSDTLYFQEFIDMEARRGDTLYSPYTRVTSHKLSHPGDSFEKLNREDRYNLIKLFRLANIHLNYYGSLPIEFGLNGSNKIDNLSVLQRAIYGFLPTELIVCHDSIRELDAPLCPNATREVIKKLKKLHELHITPLSNEPYTIDLSDLDMHQVKKMYLHGINCERIIFPEENSLEVLVLSDCNFTHLDSSFKYLDKLRRLQLYNLPLKKVDLSIFNNLDTLIVEMSAESPPKKQLLENANPNLFVDFCQKTYCSPLPPHSSIRREEYKSDTLYQKFAAAAGCK